GDGRVAAKNGGRMFVMFHATSLAKLLVYIVGGIAERNFERPRLHGGFQRAPFVHRKNMLRTPVGEVRRVVHEADFMNARAELVLTSLDEIRNFGGIILERHADDMEWRR